MGLYQRTGSFEGELKREIIWVYTIELSKVFLLERSSLHSLVGFLFRCQRPFYLKLFIIEEDKYFAITAC